MLTQALPRPNAHIHYKREVGATYSFDRSMNTMISYDTVDMQKQKADFIREYGLGGAMWWESSGDRQGEESLIGTVCLLCFTHLPGVRLQDDKALLMVLSGREASRRSQST